MKHIGINEQMQYSSKKEEQLSIWANSLFFEKMVNHGFLSYQNKGLSWYKVIDESIIQTVYLFSNSNLVLSPVLGCGCHPLFISAPLPQKVTVTGYGRDDVQMSIYHFPSPKVMYSKVPVLFSKDIDGATVLLDEVVFPKFDELHTIEDCYQIHRESIRTRMDAFLAQKSWADYNGMVASWDFIDELIYMGDWEMLKYCDRDLSPSFCHNSQQHKRVEEQRAAIHGETRDDFLRMLEKRKNRYISRLRKHGLISR